MKKRVKFTRLNYNDPYIKLRKILAQNILNTFTNVFNSTYTILYS
jgi:hypothetical protein